MTHRGIVMRGIAKQVLALGLLLASGCDLKAQAVTYQPGLVPNAKQQFTDSNGAPLAGGRVYFYVPGTTTPSPTYQDPADTVLNTNPVVLDAGGRAIIWGTGTYREIVKDANGVLVWDQVTSQLNVASSGCPDQNFGFFQFSTNTGGNWICAGAAGLTTFDAGASINLNAVQPNVQGVGTLNIKAGTTGGNTINLIAGNGAGSGQGATETIAGGSANIGGNLTLQAGAGDTDADGGQIIVDANSGSTYQSPCTLIKQDLTGGTVPTSRVYIQAGSGADPACAAYGAGIIELNGLVQFDQGYNYGSAALFVDSPSTGNTVTFPDTTSVLEINPSGTLATLTVQLPTCSAAFNGKVAWWSTTQIISSVTITATAGAIRGYLLPSPGTINAYAGQYFICRGSNSTWYQQSFNQASP